MCTVYPASKIYAIQIYMEDSKVHCMCFISELSELKVVEASSMSGFEAYYKTDFAMQVPVLKSCMHKISYYFANFYCWFCK